MFLFQKLIKFNWAGVKYGNILVILPKHDTNYTGIFQFFGNVHLTRNQQKSQTDSTTSKLLFGFIPIKCTNQIMNYK